MNVLIYRGEADFREDFKEHTFIDCPFSKTFHWETLDWLNNTYELMTEKTKLQYSL